MVLERGVESALHLDSGACRSLLTATKTDAFMPYVVMDLPPCAPHNPLVNINENTMRNTSAQPPSAARTGASAGGEAFDFPARTGARRVDARADGIQVHAPEKTTG